MSTNITKVEDGQVYTGYDDLAAPVQFCTPSYLGFSACIGATVVSGYVSLVITLNTPIGSYSKTFQISKGGTFTWEPVKKFKLEISITNFSETGTTFSFDLGAKLCIDVPIFGWKCVSYSYHFNVPTALNLKGFEELSDAEFSNMLVLSALLEQEQKCNCH